MSSSPSLRWGDVRRLLCVRLDNMGDVLMTTPALRALKQSLPDSSLTLLTSRAAAPVVPYIPEIDDLLVYDAPWVRQPGPDIGPEMDFAMIERICSGRFDAAVIFTVYSQSALPAALVCRLAGIPLRLAHVRENPYQLLTDWVQDPEPQRLLRHEVQRQLDLVAGIGATTEDERLSFRIDPADREKVLMRLRSLGVCPEAPWILVHPGATAASRRYPADSFAIVARLLYERLRCPIVFGGTRAEQPLVQEVRRMMRVPSYSLAGALSLGEAAAAIAQARVLVSNNSGPVHIAAALGTPVVDLYALTNPQHTPWRVPHRVLSHDVPCKYCYRSVCPEGHHACLRGVQPAEVVAAAVELFGASTEPTTLPAGGAAA